MDKKNEPFFKLEDFAASLQEALAKQPLDLVKMIRAAVPVKDPDAQPRHMPAGMDRHQIILTDGTAACGWKVDSLRALFRGDKQPPELGDYPTAYQKEFALLETHVVEISTIFSEPTDQEMKEIYSNLRRRPEGRSLGFFHDYMWQAAAFLLGSQPLSQAEFEAILGRLERSCRTFSMGLASRNYAGNLRKMFGGEL